MLNDYIICPECHERLEAELVRCRHCHAYVHDTSPWRKDNILLVSAISVAILIAVFLIGLALSKEGVMAMMPDYVAKTVKALQTVLNDGISKVIFALGLYGIVLLIFKNRITLRQQRTFRIIREYCASHGRPAKNALAEIRERIQDEGLGAYNTLLAYTRLHWLVETAHSPKEERETRIRAMREHGDTDWEAMDSAFASVQYLIWLLPSLGFLGTVWGMTQALVTFQDAVSFRGGGSDLAFKTSLGETAQGLGVAFHTTLVGLAMVIPVLLIATACRRRTKMFLEQLDKFFIRMSTQVSLLEPVTDDPQTGVSEAFAESRSAAVDAEPESAEKQPEEVSAPQSDDTAPKFRENEPEDLTSTEEEDGGGISGKEEERPGEEQGEGRREGIVFGTVADSGNHGEIPDSRGREEDEANRTV